MEKRNRKHLRNEFREGQRPSGEDFADLIESFINKEDDELDVDPADGSLVVTGGVELGNTSRDVAGTLRFVGGTVEVHDGVSYVPISGGGNGSSVFQPVGGGDDVAYDLGNVGIGSFATPPTYALEVNLEVNSAEGDRVRFGNVVLSNFPGVDTDACFYHRSQATATGVALRQRATGEVRINAPTGQRIRFQHDGNQTRMAVTGDGNIVIGGASEITALDDMRLQVSGNAFKSVGGGQWRNGCDEQLKDDIRDLDYGLDEVLQVRPVRFRYNGKAGTKAGDENIGIVGQEIEEIFPDMVHRVPARPEDDLNTDDVLIFDGSGIQFVLINAVKELAAKIKKLEADLAQATGEK